MSRLDHNLGKLKVNTIFYCRSKKRRVGVGDCLERYVDANAFENKRSACWRCFQGKRTRLEFARQP